MEIGTDEQQAIFRYLDLLSMLQRKWFLRLDLEQFAYEFAKIMTGGGDCPGVALCL